MTSGLVRIAQGYGPIESFRDFVNYTAWVNRNTTQSYDRVFMDALLTYYPSLHAAVTDTHAGCERHPWLFRPGSKEALLSLDHVMGWLEHRWETLG